MGERRQRGRGGPGRSGRGRACWVCWDSEKVYVDKIQYILMRYSIY